MFVEAANHFLELGILASVSSLPAVMFIERFEEVMSKYLKPSSRRIEVDAGVVLGLNEVEAMFMQGINGAKRREQKFSQFKYAAKL